MILIHQAMVSRETRTYHERSAVQSGTVSPADPVTLTKKTLSRRGRPMLSLECAVSEPADE